MSSLPFSYKSPLQLTNQGPQKSQCSVLDKQVTSH